MRTTLKTLLLVLPALPALAAAAPAAGQKNAMAGDYVEARTASVFAGPCHYNGELTTTGREAEAAWRINQGSWNGVSLNGVTAVAGVVSEANLKNENAGRNCVLYIDSKASVAQADAFVAAVQANWSRSLGNVVAIRRAPVRFEKISASYHVTVPGVTHLAVDAMPNHACCTMPNLVRYAPLVTLEGRRVGFTRTSGVSEKALHTAWQKNGQNTAFYGKFAL